MFCDSVSFLRLWSDYFVSLWMKNASMENGKSFPFCRRHYFSLFCYEIWLIDWCLTPCFFSVFQLSLRVMKYEYGCLSTYVYTAYSNAIHYVTITSYFNNEMPFSMTIINISLFIYIWHSKWWLFIVICWFIRNNSFSLIIKTIIFKFRDGIHISIFVLLLRDSRKKLWKWLQFVMKKTP